MSEPLFMILWFGGVVGIPLIAMVVLGYFTVWRGKVRPFVVANLAVAAAACIFVFMEGPGDMSAPVPGLIWILFFVFYLPGQVLLAGLVGGGFWFFRRRCETNASQ